MKIKSAEFVKSSQSWKECPESKIQEYAFIGRSNVGKSSLINALTSRKYLAKTSGTPGKTQLINHFIINESWFLTDLPGYGYAKVSKSSRKVFQKLITDYILNRQQLTNLFILIDSRHDPLQIDIDFITFVGESQIPFSIIYTKYDKVKPKGFEDTLKKHEAKLYEVFSDLPPIFVTSAETKHGCDEILDYIEQINAN